MVENVLEQIFHLYKPNFVKLQQAVKGGNYNVKSFKFWNLVYAKYFVFLIWKVLSQTIDG